MKIKRFVFTAWYDHFPLPVFEDSVATSDSLETLVDYILGNVLLYLKSFNSNKGNKLCYSGGNNATISDLKTGKEYSLYKTVEIFHHDYSSLDTCMKNYLRELLEKYNSQIILENTKRNWEGLTKENIVQFEADEKQKFIELFLEKAEENTMKEIISLD